MGKLKWHPSHTDPGAALRLAQFLLKHHATGEWPFNISEPGVMVAKHAPRLFGSDLPKELVAQMIFNLSLTDISVDSMQIAALMLRDCLDYLDLYRPKMIWEDRRWIEEQGPDRDMALPTLRDRIDELLGSKWGHKLWRVLSLYWLESSCALAEEWNGSALELYQSGKTAKELLVYLLSTRNGELLTKEERKKFPGFGNKTSRVLIARIANSGLAPVEGLCEIGPPMDIHATLLSVSCGALNLEGSTPVGSVVNALHALWQEVSAKHELDVVRLYEALWMWGRRMCRQAECRHCPLWVKGKRTRRNVPRCIGRIASTSYYGGEHGVRRIDPTLLIDVGMQLELQLGLMPEVTNGLYDPDYPTCLLMAQLARPEESLQIALPGIS
jgi:hypothetical protein